MQIQFSFFVFDLMIVALKRIEAIIGENAFEQKKKKPGLAFNHRLPLINLQATNH